MIVAFIDDKTVLRSGEYGRAAIPLVERLGFAADDYWRAGGLSVIRCTVMDPFLASSRGRTSASVVPGRTVLRTTTT